MYFFQSIALHFFALELLGNLVNLNFFLYDYYDKKLSKLFSGMNHDGGRYHSRGQGSGGQGGRSPALSLASGSGGQRSRRGSRRSPLNSPGTPMYNEVLSQPGVKPTQDISDR